MQHVVIKCHYLRELKENRLIKIEYQPGIEMKSNLFTKNLEKAGFECHTMNDHLNIDPSK